MSISSPAAFLFAAISLLSFSLSAQQKLPVAATARPSIAVGEKISLCVRVQEQGVDTAMITQCNLTVLVESIAEKPSLKGATIWKALGELPIDTNVYCIERVSLYKLEAGRAVEHNSVTLQAAKKSICPTDEYVAATAKGEKIAFADVVLRKYAQGIPLSKQVPPHKIAENCVAYVAPAIRAGSEVHVCWRTLPAGWQALKPSPDFDAIFSVYNCTVLKAEADPIWGTGVITEQQAATLLAKLIPAPTKTTAWLHRWTNDSFVDEKPKAAGTPLRWTGASAQNYLNEHLMLNAKGEVVLFVEVEMPN